MATEMGPDRGPAGGLQSRTAVVLAVLFVILIGGLAALMLLGPDVLADMVTSVQVSR